MLYTENYYNIILDGHASQWPQQNTILIKNVISEQLVDELARVLLRFKRPTRPHRTATVLIIGNFLLEF